MRQKKIIHHIYTAEIYTENNCIKYDVRRSKQNVNKVILYYRITRPEALHMPSLSILSRQRNKTFESRSKAREYISKLINQF